MTIDAASRLDAQKPSSDGWRDLCSDTATEGAAAAAAESSADTPSEEQPAAEGMPEAFTSADEALKQARPFWKILQDACMHDGI